MVEAVQVESELRIFHKIWKWVVVDVHIQYRSCAPSVRQVPVVVPMVFWTAYSIPHGTPLIAIGCTRVPGAMRPNHLHTRSDGAMFRRLLRRPLLRILPESFSQVVWLIQVVPISPEVQHPLGGVVEIAVPGVEEWEMECPVDIVVVPA